MSLSQCQMSHLSSAESNHQVSDEGILGLSGAMAHHHAPAIALGHLATKTKIIKRFLKTISLSQKTYGEVRLKSA